MDTNAPVIDGTATVTNETPIRNKREFAVNLLKAAAPTLIVAGVILLVEYAAKKADA